MSIHNSCGLCRISIKNLSVKSGNDTILDNINMDFHCGQLTALIGKNGAGKTTLLKAILGEKNHTGTIGYIRHDNTSLEKVITGYVPQHLSFDKSSPVSVFDFMLSCETNRPVWLYHKSKYREDIINRLDELSISHIFNRAIGDLSGGELQRVLLAIAINPRPDLLILDEPVSGVDIAGLDLFYNTISKLRDEYHMAILLVSHDLSLIKKYADKVVLLDKTVLDQGNVYEVFSSDEFKNQFGFSPLRRP